MNHKIQYEGLTQSGESVVGVFEGDEAAFKKFIVEKKLIIKTYKPIKKKLKTQKLTKTQIKSLLEELHYLVMSGMRIEQAIKLLKKNSDSVSLSELLDTVNAELQKGMMLSKALEMAIDALKYLTVEKYVFTLVETNEAVGNIALGLKKAAEYLTFKEEVGSDIKQALSYPLFLLGTSVVIVFFVFVFIVPKFSAIFSPEEFHKLPSLSRAVLSTGMYVDQNLQMILLGMVAFVFMVILSRQKIAFYFKDILYKTPLLKGVALKIEISYVFGSLGMLLNGGIDIAKALDQSIKLANYQPLKNLFSLARSEIKRGIKLSDTFSDSPIIPSSAVSLIAVGENSGKLDEVLLKLSQRAADDFRKETKKLLSLLEPMIIIFLGLFIAFIVTAIMMAVMSVSEIV